MKKLTALIFLMALLFSQAIRADQADSGPLPGHFQKDKDLAESADAIVVAK